MPTVAGHQHDLVFVEISKPVPRRCQIGAAEVDEYLPVFIRDGVDVDDHIAGCSVDFGAAVAQTLRFCQIKITPGAKSLEMPAVIKAREEAELALQGKGRLVLRASGTEPLIRVTVEAADANLMQSVLDQLSAVVRASL